MATRRRDKGTGSIYRDLERGGWKGELRLDNRSRPYVRRGKTRAEVVDKGYQGTRDRLVEHAEAIRAKP